jgi:hypothetical protein
MEKYGLKKNPEKVEMVIKSSEFINTNFEDLTTGRHFFKGPVR